METGGKYAEIIYKQSAESFKTCRKSEYNGAMFVCSANGCSVCNDNNIMRLQRCDSYEDTADCNTDDLRL